MDHQQKHALELLKRRLLELKQTHEEETKILRDFVKLRSDNLESKILSILRLCGEALNIEQQRILEPRS